MLSSFRAGLIRPDDEPERELIPQSWKQGDGDEHQAGEITATGVGQDKSRDKIRCLDGLRGVACFIVFNYHFLWPWTPRIMLSYGARPPKSPEPYNEWSSFPIISLLYRGRPMVAIFFAISGYVLCRHILRSIHQRRVETAYKMLASSAFRRIFRLYIPPTVSMLVVAILAQMGAFKSEEAIFQGPDSVYINGTVTTGAVNRTCANGTTAVFGTSGIAEALRLSSPIYLNQTINWNDTVCLNITSQLFGSAALYGAEDKALDLPSNVTLGLNITLASEAPGGSLRDKSDAPHATATPSATPSGIRTLGTGTGSNVGNATEYVWIQIGGMWEEHPHIHANMTRALANFTRVYVEWANPFSFNHYHTRYDPHTYTIPIEFRGSMVLYTFLLATAALKAKWRLALAGALSAYSLAMGRWEMGTFVGGMLLSEIDVLRSADPTEVAPDDRILVPRMPSREAGPPSSSRSSRVFRWLWTMVALYLLSYPDAGAEYTPGFRLLSSLAPRYYHPLSRWMYYQSIGALLLVFCVLRSPLLRHLLVRQVSQYLGRISFSFYLVHGPVLHSLGFWIMPRLFEHFGRPFGFAIGWIVLLSVTLCLAGWWYKIIDMWSVRVGKRIERALVNS